MLNTDLASVFCEATDLLLFTFFECIVVMDKLEEKLCASTALTLASPNIILEALWPLPAMADMRSLDSLFRYRVYNVV
jgi:hypothetical protein